MYRVELKDWKTINLSSLDRLFLMYRVELKDIRQSRIFSNKNVPNVPCGVERQGVRWE